MFRLFDVVKIIKLNRTFDLKEITIGERVPKVGDKATIVEIYNNPILGYELECVGKDASTIWLTTFNPNDAVFELLYLNV